MRRLALFLLRVYQRFVSPLLPPACRFHPTCSVYAVGCFQQYGFFRACRMTIVRLSKCHPFHPGGLDPVPEPGEEKSS